MVEFVESDVEEDDLRLLADAQTSGGLLVSLPSETAEKYRELVPGSVEIGQITSRSGIRVTA